MNEKKIPQPVVLKKWLVVGAIGMVILMVSLIGWNLVQSSHNQNVTTHRANQTVQSVATTEDADSIQKKATVNRVVSTPRTIQIPASPDPPKNDVQVTERQVHEREVQQLRQELLQAMSAPISSNQITAEKSQTPTRSDPDEAGITGAMNASDSDQNRQNEKLGFVQSNRARESSYLGAILEDPISPYELQAGTIIPGVLITGINSDLPGQLTGQVSSNVYDSISGKYLLIPQGARLTGLYDSQVAYGQERVLVVWKRIIFPNGQSLNLQGMPGVDMSGYAGFNDKVNNHYDKIFGSVVLMSVIGAGAQLAQPQNTSTPFAAPTIGQTLAQSVGTNLANTSMMITSKNINIQPTLEIRPGYQFNISVTKDIVLPGPYGQQG